MDESDEKVKIDKKDEIDKIRQMNEIHYYVQHYIASRGINFIWKSGLFSVDPNKEFMALCNKFFIRVYAK